jgi:hypothetical protein
LLGGAANYLLLHKDDPAYANRARSYVLGLVASLLAPLLLRTISSNLVDKVTSIRWGSGIPFEFFVFASFCLLTAIFSRTFAETVAKRLAAEVERAQRESREAQARAVAAEEKAAQAEPILRKEIERRTEPPSEPASAAVPPSLQDLPIDHSDRQLLKALLAGQYTYRTVKSLAQELQMEEPVAVKRLERMREQALAGRRNTATRNLWYLTDKGCQWLAAQGGAEGGTTRGQVM